MDELQQEQQVERIQNVDLEKEIKNHFWRIRCLLLCRASGCAGWIKAGTPENFVHDV